MPLTVEVTSIAFTEKVKKYDCDLAMTSGREYEETGDVRLCFPRISFQTSLLSCELHSSLKFLMNIYIYKEDLYMKIKFTAILLEIDHRLQQLTSHICEL